MVDVDRRMAALSPSHAAGLRRLSARAAAIVHASSSRRLGLLSLRPLAETVLAYLHAAFIPLRPGLSEAELARLEADLAFSFPPDLRAILALAVPSGSGFPDWRAPSPTLLRLPVAAATVQVARGALWPRSWGRRPADPSRAIRRARAALRRAPLLLPLFGRCYIPCFPSLAGNPVFYVDEARVFCCALDLADFFQRHSAVLGYPEPSSHLRILHATSAAGISPRWIEFWSDAATDHRRRNSSSSSSSSSASSASSSPPPDPERFLEIRAWKLPDWVGSYLDGVGSVLRQGGWSESDVREMVHVPAMGIFNGGDEPAAAAGAIDADAVLDALLVKADRCSDLLRRAGWSLEEVSDALGLDIGRRHGRYLRPPVKLPPSIALKVEKLVEAVTGS
ncbi:hypothetical protein OPV22_023733 [Ensete ventricosum]|uniref:Knr4/Smi1-like domain-containing protein n=1 Tax=Ensete ventricosum TaxID=4639 RepID=A0A445MHH2_ENSVE|nr:hypothetical protein OPV22_023733 [Ensete ventricosum]RZR73734.1 hypothetical protein BHM03_00027624 [Ensete ventricosum]